MRLLFGLLLVLGLFGSPGMLVSQNAGLSN